MCQQARATNLKVSRAQAIVVDDRKAAILSLTHDVAQIWNLMLHDNPHGTGQGDARASVLRASTAQKLTPSPESSRKGW